MNTGARVTYAMGKDAEVPEHFGMLHAESLSPRKAIWTLAWISAVIGVIAISLMFGDAGAPTDATIAALPHGIFSSWGYLPHDTLAKLPNSLLALTLTSNFGTFILYGLSCLLCIVAYHSGPTTACSSTRSFRDSGCSPTSPAWRSTWLDRSSTSAQRWNPSRPSASQLYGAFMERFSSCDRQRHRANQCFWPQRTLCRQHVNQGKNLGGFSPRPRYERLGRESHPS
jgi:hypothetical protein